MRLTWHPAKLAFLPELQPVAEALAPDATLYVISQRRSDVWEQPSPLPEWSFRQLLAHIATGDWVLQLHLRSLIDEGRPAEWPDVAAGNARMIEERRFSTERALVEEYLSMRHETMLLLAQLKPRHLAEKIRAWWEATPNEHTVLEYLDGFESHDRLHREQLRPAMKYLHAQGADADFPPHEEVASRFPPMSVDLPPGEEVDRATTAELIHGKQGIAGTLFMTNRRLMFEAKKGDARWMVVPYGEMRSVGLFPGSSAAMGVPSSRRQCLFIETTKGEHVWWNFGDKEEAEWLPIVKDRAAASAAGDDPSE